MLIDISPSDSSTVLLCRLKSLLLYPKQDDSERRECAFVSFYMHSLLRTSDYDKICSCFSADMLSSLNNAASYSDFHDLYSNRLKNQIYTVFILLRLIIAGSEYYKKPMSLTYALDIYSKKYDLQANTEGNTKRRPSNRSSAKNHWLAMDGVQHLCTAWKAYNPSKKHDDGLPLKKRLLKLLAIADRYYQLTSDQVNAWRKEPLLTPDKCWMIPPTFDLPEVDDTDLKLFKEEQFTRFSREFGRLG